MNALVVTHLANSRAFIWKLSDAVHLWNGGLGETTAVSRRDNRERSDVVGMLTSYFKGGPAFLSSSG